MRETNSSVRIERVDGEDWRSHRDLRLEMLRTDPRSFWARLEDDAARSEGDWRAEIAGPRLHLQARRDRPMTTGPRGTDGLRSGPTPPGAGDGVPSVPEVLGGIAVLPQGYTPEHVIAEDQAILVSLWVRPEARGSGVSRLLLRGASELALCLGRPELLLEVDDAQRRARRFYQRIGFTETGVRHPRERTGGQWIEYVGRADALVLD